MSKYETLYYDEISELNTKVLVLQHIAVCKFKVKSNRVLIKIERSKTNVIIRNSDIKKFESDLLGCCSLESILDYLCREMLSLKNETLTCKLRKYKRKRVRGYQINHNHLLKLYSKSKITSKIRQQHNALWIDYETQLNKSNIIYDSKKGLGIWSFHTYQLDDCLNEECFERYGRFLLVLEPIKFCLYLDTGKEVIGRKYKVVAKFDTTTPTLKKEVEKYLE